MNREAKAFSSDSLHTLLGHLIALYGDSVGRTVLEQVQHLLENYGPLLPPPDVTGLTQQDAILITYGDQIREPDVLHLHGLAEFCETYLTGLISGLHILPFYPSSSDDGFAVINYRTVEPALGTWADVDRLGQRFQLMFDAVINHVSAQSEWFQAFRRDDPIYRNYFIVVPEGVDLSMVVRPRALPLLLKIPTPSGEKAVWTTFSEDQVDLNYANPAVLLDITETLLFYIAHGARFIRLDAVAYLWKEFGTPCIHHPKTHRLIQFFRALLDCVAPQVALITETNVPHVENLTYFSDGTNEAQLIYNFALPPLVLHTFQTGNARRLSDWATGLSLPSDRVTFFNFLASHDGIGLNPVKGILAEPEIEALVARTLANGGEVSYKANPDGSPSPYELNINYFDALTNPAGEESLELQVDRFIAAQAIMLALVGVPGIYFHSLFGSRGWSEGVKLTKSNRAINRQKYDRTYLEEELSDPDSRRYKIFTRYAQLLKARAASAAFHPHGKQRVIQTEEGQAVFAMLRSAPDGGEQVLCLHNVSGQSRQIEIDMYTGGLETAAGLIDLIGAGPLEMSSAKTLTVALAPYQTRWLRVDRK